MALSRPPEMPWHNEVYKRVSLGKRTAASIHGNGRMGGKNQTARERALRMNERASVFTEIRFADHVLACGSLGQQHVSFLGAFTKQLASKPTISFVMYVRVDLGEYGADFGI